MQRTSVKGNVRKDLFLEEFVGVQKINHLNMDIACRSQKLSTWETKSVTESPTYLNYLSFVTTPKRLMAEYKKLSMSRMPTSLNASKKFHTQIGLSWLNRNA